MTPVELTCVVMLAVFIAVCAATLPLSEDRPGILAVPAVVGSVFCAVASALAFAP